MKSISEMTMSDWFQGYQKDLAQEHNRFYGAFVGVKEISVLMLGDVAAPFEHVAFFVGNAVGPVLSLLARIAGYSCFKEASLKHAWLHLNLAVKKLGSACGSLVMWVPNVPFIVLLRLFNPAFRIPPSSQVVLSDQEPEDEPVVDAPAASPASAATAAAVTPPRGSKTPPSTPNARSIQEAEDRCYFYGPDKKIRLAVHGDRPFVQAVRQSVGIIEIRAALATRRTPATPTPAKPK